MIAGAVFKLAKLPIVYLATKMGKDHLLRQPFVRQATTSSNSELEDLALVVGENAQRFNRGMMSQMQDNPSDTTNQCYIDTALTNVALNDLSDITAYLTADGYYKEDVFFQLLQVSQFAFVTQLDSCNYMQFLIALDGMFSNIPQATAAVVNLATQVGTGFENQDTSIYLSWKKIEAGMEDDNNW